MRRLRKSLFIQFLTTGLTAVFQLAYVYILSRYLMPDEFGASGVVLGAVSVLSLLGHAGLGSALIQRKEIDREHVDSVVLFNLFSGLFLAALLILFNHQIALLFDDDRLVLYLNWIAAVLPLSVLYKCYNAILLRKMQFVALGLIELFSMTTAMAAGIVLVQYGKGVMALIYASILQYSILFVLNYYFARMRFSWTYSRKKLNELLPFSYKITGLKIIDMLLNESVLLIVGPFIGLAKTGMIERTQKLANTPASIAGEVLHKVFLSNFSSTQSTEENYQSMQIIIKITLAIALPFTYLLSLHSDFITHLVLGDNWSVLVGPLGILILIVPFRIIYRISNTYLQAMGKPERAIYGNIIVLILVTGAFALVQESNVEGYCSIILMGSALQALIVVFGVERSIETSRRKFLEYTLVYCPLTFMAWCVHRISITVIDGYGFIEEVSGILLEVSVLFLIISLFLQWMPKGYKLEIIFDTLFNRKKQD